MKLYNSLNRRIEKFKPIKKGHVSMYVCGPTVNGPGHLGHASTYVAFDLIRRSFEYLGYDVKLVVNLTDIHDDMISEANKRGITVFELADKYIAQFMKDIEALNIKPADVYPRVTGHIKEIVEMIEILREKGYAYETDDGVYFSVEKFSKYGAVSGVKVAESRGGQRVDTDKYDKEGAADFVLWKKWKEGEPYWDSPWGKGRPGWHIECSVMSRKHLGQPFDIHGGALDLRFPHHENEVAQSEATYGTTFVNYWMHAGLIKVDGQKMSNSLGNFIEIPDVLKQFDPMVVRYWRASVHYRSEINYSKELLEGATTAMKRLREGVAKLKQKSGGKTGKVIKKYGDAFVAALEDDFNFPEAVALLWKVVKTDEGSAEDRIATIRDFDKVFGLDICRDGKGITKLDSMTEKKVETLLKERKEARENKDWDRADTIRKELEELGVSVEDTKDGPVWTIQ